MKALLTFFLIVLFFPSWGQKSNTKNLSLIEEAKPEMVGMSLDRLLRIDAMLDEQLEGGRIPGVVVLVARNGKVVYHKAKGFADADKQIPLKTDHIFRLASQSKAITSTAVMMLWEEGKFRLDDPVSNYIPELKGLKVLTGFKYADTSYISRPSKSEITIRQLLTHTSGLGYGAIDSDERIRLIYEKAGAESPFKTDSETLGDFVKRLGQLPLHFDPGEKYLYSYGIDVSGYLVEVLSGMPLDVFLRERLFAPLGMKDTYFYLPQEKVGRLVRVQQKSGQGWEGVPDGNILNDYPVSGAKSFFGGGGGLVGTAMDYALFLQMLLNGGSLNGKQLLSPTTVKIMTANHTGSLYGGTDSYHGLAFSVLTAVGAEKGGRGSEGTFSWGGYFNTQYYVDPQEKVVGVILKQTLGNTGDETGWKFQQLVGAAIDD